MLKECRSCIFSDEKYLCRKENNCLFQSDTLHILTTVFIVSDDNHDRGHNSNTEQPIEEDGNTKHQSCLCCIGISVDYSLMAATD